MDWIAPVGDHLFPCGLASNGIEPAPSARRRGQGEPVAASLPSVPVASDAYDRVTTERHAG